MSLQRGVKDPDMFDGKIKVSNDTSAPEPTAENVKIDFQGTILA